MGYTKPTAQDVKTRFQHFATVDVGLIDMLLNEVPVDDTWAEKSYRPAIFYWVAHRLTVEKKGSGASAVSGPVTSRSIGDASESYAVSTTISNNDDYSTTPYGKEFIRLRNVNFAGPLSI